jgi:serine/threonine protein kinase
LIHRDLKPGNIFLTYDNDTIVPKIGDFGLAASIMEQQVDVVDNNLPKITLIEEMSFSNSRIDSSNNMTATTLDSSCSSTDNSNSRCSSRESRRNRTIGVGTRTVSLVYYSVHTIDSFSISTLRLSN